jgi:hypothetical protein
MPADSGVNEKRFCIGFRVGFGPFAMASATTSVENPMVKSKNCADYGYCAILRL